MAHNSSHLSKYTQHNKAQPSKSFPLGAGFQQVILLYNAYFFQGANLIILFVIYPLYRVNRLLNIMSS